MIMVSGCTSHTFAGVMHEPAVPVTDFALIDQSGASFSLSDLRGRWILLAYGYTHCPDVCPLTLAHLREVKKQLNLDTDQLAVVFVTIDPERDTTDVMQQYIEHFDAQFKALTGNARQIAKAAAAFNVKYAKQASDSAAGYSLQHTAYIFAIDPEFQLRVTYPYEVLPDEIVADLRYMQSQ
jgi:protein SCO1/2